MSRFKTLRHSLFYPMEKTKETDQVKKLDDLDQEDKANKIALRKLRKEKLAKLRQELTELKQIPKDNTILISNLDESTQELDVEQEFTKYGKILKIEQKSSTSLLVHYENHESIPLSLLLDNTSFKNSIIKVEKYSSANPSSSSLTSEQRDLLQQKKRRLMKRSIEIKNMFRPEEFNDDLKSDITLDIYDECKKHEIFSSIKSIEFINDIVKVSFDNTSLCEKCIEKFNGRYFDGLKLSVS